MSDQQHHAIVGKHIQFVVYWIDPKKHLFIN